MLLSRNRSTASLPRSVTGSAGAASDWMSLAIPTTLLGETLLRLGRLEEAGPLLEEGYRGIRAYFPGSHPQTVEAKRRLDEYQQTVSRR